jgi:glycosyltransferase involved in cell wall biosynthesis
LISALIAFHQPRYEAAIKKMDCVVTNSLNVKSRIKTFLGVDAKVVYPPCETHTFQWISQGDFYLSAARLDPLKRVDRIVDAFKKMPDQRLVVISDGPQRKKIDAQAAGHDTIKVLGGVSGER